MKEWISDMLLEQAIDRTRTPRTLFEAFRTGAWCVSRNVIKLSTALHLIAFTTVTSATADEDAKRFLLLAEFDELVPQSKKWISDSPESAFAKLSLALAEHFSGGVLPDKGVLPLLDDGGESEILIWLESLNASDKGRWPAILMRAIISEKAGNADDVKRLVQSAYDASEQNEILLRTVVASDRNIAYTAIIPKADPVTYTGNMWLKKQSWVPIDPSIPKLKDYANFSVNSGVLQTGKGQFNFSAVFNEWSYVRSDNEIYSWSAIASEGEILIPSLPSDILAGVVDKFNFSVDVDFDSVPFDIFSNYRLIKLDSSRGRGFPVSTVRGIGKREFLFVGGNRFSTSVESLVSAPGVFGEGSLVLSVTDGNLNGIVHIIESGRLSE